MAASMQVVTDQWIPYENLSNADAPGFTTEVVRQVFAMLGEQVTIEELPWARAAEMVFRGERDAIFTAFYSEERARYCHFPKEPVARDEWVFFVRTEDAGRLKFSSFDDLVGHQIAAVRGASISSEFWDFVRRHGNVTETVTDEANFRMLDAGRVDYIVASLVNGRRLIASLGLDGKIQPLEARSIKQDDLHIIFSKQRVSPEFVDRFSDALRRFKQTEAFQTIYRKYFNATPQGSGSRP
jgi:polar amino acid transport system substrate-binding protein